MKLTILFFLVFAACGSASAQLKFVVSTDKPYYQYGDTMRVSIVAIDTTDSAATMQLSYCDVTFFLDGQNVKAHVPCPLVLIDYTVQPHDSLNLGPGFLPPFPITDTLSYGSHIVMGLVDGYSMNNIDSIAVVSQAQAETDSYWPLETGDEWQYLVVSVNSDPTVPIDSSIYTARVAGDTVLPNGYGYEEVRFDGAGVSQLFERLDYSTGIVYRYDTLWPGDERVIDSLAAQPGDTVSSTPNTPQPVPYSYYRADCVSSTGDTLLGLPTTSRSFKGGGMFETGYALAAGLGLYSYTSEWDFGKATVTMTYAKIGGAEHGNQITLGIDQPPPSPREFVLSQNYPNPFNPTTNIGFRIADVGFVTLKVYNVLGQLVRTLVSKVEQPGSYRVEFNGSGLASGVYFYRLGIRSLDGKGMTFMKTMKLMLLK